MRSCCNEETGLHHERAYENPKYLLLGGIDFDPTIIQEHLVVNYNNYRYSINMLGRQMGKTTVAAGYLLWYAMFKPDSTILVAAHKQAGASEIMQRIRYAYESCPTYTSRCP